jgi:hypothetical protein
MSVIKLIDIVKKLSLKRERKEERISYLINLCKLLSYGVELLKLDILYSATPQKFRLVRLSPIFICIYHSPPLSRPLHPAGRVGEVCSGNSTIFHRSLGVFRVCAVRLRRPSESKNGNSVDKNMSNFCQVTILIKSG